ncbi:uncharacterized protein LOC142350705 [Convolutriloba macropyga]|uniref:uncharacterized protein LOC142350705 n=1 Tax=Convolutriloba macropyga TaxID=536237 RepID=UPI003F525B58
MDTKICLLLAGVILVATARRISDIKAADVGNFNGYKGYEMTPIGGYEAIKPEAVGPRGYESRGSYEGYKGYEMTPIGGYGAIKPEAVGPRGYESRGGYEGYNGYEMTPIGGYGAIKPEAVGARGYESRGYKGYQENEVEFPLVKGMA